MAIHHSLALQYVLVISGMHEEYLLVVLLHIIVLDPHLLSSPDP